MDLTKKDISIEKAVDSSNTVCGKYLLYPDETGSRRAEGGLRLAGKYKHSLPDKPLITIVTVVYNNEETLERCINSVLEQKYDNIEYIIIDGGSTDGTLEIIKKYQNSIDYFVSEPDDGIYNAMNKGISLSAGNYLCFLNSDDYYSNDFISESVKMSMRTNADIIYSDYYMGETEIHSGVINEGTYIHHLNINHCTFLASKETYNKVGPYREAYQIVSDVVWMRRAFANNIDFVHLPKSMFYFADGGLSSGNSEKRRNLLIEEAGQSCRETFDFLTQHEAEELYLSRFNLNRIENILNLYDRYGKEETLFRISLQAYMKFILSNKYIFRENDIKNYFRQYLEICQKLEIPYSCLSFADADNTTENILSYVDNISKKISAMNHKNTILHFVSNFNAPSETFIYDLIRYFDENTEYENYVLCDTRELEIERPYDKVIHIPWDEISEELGLSLYKYLFESLKPDIVICHFMLNGWKLYERLNKIDLDFPTIHMTHGIDVFLMNTNQEYKNFVLEFIDPNPQHKITTVSDYLRSKLLEFGISKNNITLIHNAANERFFQYRKEKFHKENDTLRIINFGRLIGWKGHIYLLEGLKYFIDNVSKNVELTMVHANSPSRKELDEQIKKLGIGTFVNVISFVDFDQSPDFLTKFDIAINSSTYSQDKLNRSETFGMFTLEAILSGLLVIGTDAGGTPEVIGKNNKFAKIVPHANSKAIGKAIEEFYNCKECFSDNIEYAEERLSRFSREKQVALFHKLIREISMETTSVALFSTFLHGGAGYAALRLHKALLGSGVSSNIFVKRPLKNYYGVKKLDCISKPTPLRAQAMHIFAPDITMLSLNGFASTHIDLLERIKDFDIVNIHWVADDFISVENIAYLSHLDKPFVMTVRDMNPLTGGCHYFHGCDKWETDCTNCPQLISKYSDYPSKVLAAKKKYFNFSNITIVTLSHHSKRIIEKSIYKDCRIEVIPNSIETDIFVPTDKTAARTALEVPQEKKVIFFLPSYNSSIKGMGELSEALALLKDKKEEYHLMVAGSGSLDFKNDNFSITRLGRIGENEKLALAYSAADVTIVPSLEETFSNTTAESISCGTPVVGFKIGGLPDMIKDGYNGYTVELGDIKGLSGSIKKVLDGKDLSKNCRRYAEENLRLDIQAKRYMALYEELLSRSIQATGKQDLIPEVFSETAPAIINLLNEVVLSKDEQSKQKAQELSQKNQQLKKQKDEHTTQIQHLEEKLNSHQEQIGQMNTGNKSNQQQIEQQLLKINTLSNNHWYRFGQMSRKRKIWTIGKVLSKKAKIYWVLKPVAKVVKKGM